MEEKILDDISVEQFRDPATWETLRTVLRAHPNPITRHEACFFAGEMEITSLIPALQEAATKDPSIVVRHEAIEALGRMAADANAVDAFLKNLQANPHKDSFLEHADIVATLVIARKRLAKTLFSNS